MARLEGGGGRREASSLLRRTTTTGGIFPRRRRDGDGYANAAVPSDRRRRRQRRGRGMMRRDERGEGVATRDESGRWTTQGERVESDEGATRWRRTTATEVGGRRRRVGRSHQIRIRVKHVLSKFSGALKKNQGNSKITNPTKLPISKKNSFPGRKNLLRL